MVMCNCTDLCAAWVEEWIFVCSNIDFDGFWDDLITHAPGRDRASN